jgi:hypothetical protein
MLAVVSASSHYPPASDTIEGRRSEGRSTSRASTRITEEGGRQLIRLPCDRAVEGADRFSHYARRERPCRACPVCGPVPSDRAPA